MALTHAKDIEFAFYARKTGLTTATLNEMRKVYWAAQTGGSGGAFLEDLEKRWLRTLTGVTSALKPDMWKEAVVGLGQPASNSMAENKYIYYLFAP